MKSKSLAVIGCAAILGAPMGQALADGILRGDTRMACEAILCLSSAARPGACTPSLVRYFSISRKKWSDTVKARLNFLNLCPSSNQTPQMQSIVSAIANAASGGNRCDAASLNQTLRVWNGVGDGGYESISNQCPDYCANQVDKIMLPKYVGTPESGGYWVEASEYEQAVAEYQARIKRGARAGSN